MHINIRKHPISQTITVNGESKEPYMLLPSRGEIHLSAHFHTREARDWQPLYQLLDLTTAIYFYITSNLQKNSRLYHLWLIYCISLFYHIVFEECF